MLETVNCHFNQLDHSYQVSSRAHSLFSEVCLGNCVSTSSCPIYALRSIHSQLAYLHNLPESGTGQSTIDPGTVRLASCTHLAPGVGLHPLLPLRVQWAGEGPA